MNLENRKSGFINENQSHLLFKSINHSSDKSKKEISIPTVSNEIDVKTFLKRISANIELIDFEATINMEYFKIPISKKIYHVVKAILKINKDFIKKGDNIFIYNNRYWEKVNEDDLKFFLIDCMQSSGINETDSNLPKNGEFIKDQLLYSLPENKRNKSKETAINLLNGTFIITPEKRYLRDFRKEDHLFYQLKYNFDEKAKSPLFDDYLDFVLDKESHSILFSFLGYTLLGISAPNIEKALVLLGDGGSGKSVTYNVMTEVIGRENISNVPLSKIGIKDNLYVIGMEGKLLNYASEAGESISPDALKQVVSREIVIAKDLYKSPRSISDLPTLIFNVNNMPRSKDGSKAIYRRLIILHFAKIIPETKKDIELADKIIANELPGIFNKIINTIPELLKNKRFPTSKASSAALDDYNNQDDSIKGWLNDIGWMPSDIETISYKEFYQAYKSYCEMNNLKAKGSNSFSPAIKRMGFKDELIVIKGRRKKRILAELKKY